MPDRDYYLDADKAEKREKYVGYLKEVFLLLGKHGVKGKFYSDPEVCSKVANEVLLFETALAKLHLTRTESRDPKLTYNKMNILDLVKRCKNVPLEWSKYLATGIPDMKFDWLQYFEMIGKPALEMGDINVSSINAVTRFMQLLDNDALEHYLLFHVLNSFAPHLSDDFVQAHFQFHEKDLKGTSEMLPRWKRGLQGLESALGESLGKLYVAKHFPEHAKSRALQVVESVRDALRERLQEVKWMSPESRVEALKKMEKFKVKIGYPDVWRDYSELIVEENKHVANVIASRRFDFQLELRRMNAPTDRQRWFMTPQTVNAYYHPSLNEIVFPAAILQPPFFDANADVAVQYGSLGAVVGHEMTHGFDDQVRKKCA
jgi:putative endopeptidase